MTTPTSRQSTSIEEEQQSMFQLRIYTLRSPEALQQYAMVHWARHLATFENFGVTTHGVWTERSGANRLVALIRYPPGGDSEQVTRHIMASPEFAADMAGFDDDDIVDVQSVLLDPTPLSPIHR
jgi:NIPSNAP